MLSCECDIMRKDGDNPLALSSKKPCQIHTDYGRELERLRADLEAEKNQTQWACRNLCVDIRRLREKAEREQQRTVTELTTRSGCQNKKRHSNRCWRVLAKEVYVKDTGRCSKVKSTGKDTFCLCSRETHTKLEQLLLTLYEKINGEQAVYKLNHRQEFELEKAIFLCHLVEAYGRLLQGRQRAEHRSYIFKHLPSKLAQEEKEACLSDACQMLQRSQSTSHSTKDNNKQDQQKQPSDRDLCAADPCTIAAAVDSCQTSSLKIFHPHNPPHAGLGNQPPCWSEFSGSEVSLPAKCMDRNMEVSCFYISKLNIIIFVYAKSTSVAVN